MKATAWIVAACVSAQILAPLPAIAQPKPPDSKDEAALKVQAKTYVKSGDKAVWNKKWEDAYAEYSIAWTMYQDWEIAKKLGKAAYKTQHLAEAFDRLSFALERSTPEDLKIKERTEIEAMIEEIKTKTGTIAITSDKPGEVFVDRNSLGNTPLDKPIRVDPGKHEVEIRRGSTGELRSIEVTAGGNVEVKFETPKVAPPPTAAPAPSAPFPWRTPVLITGAALSVAGLAVGGVFLGVSLDNGAAKEAAAQDNNKSLAQEAADAEAQARNVMLWSFVGAGVAIAGTAAIYFVTKPTEDGPKVQGAVGVGRHGPTVWIGGEF